MKSRGKIVDVVKWRDENGEVRQCLDRSGASDYDTLCGCDLQEIEFNEEDAIIERKRGRVTCEQCLIIIDAVLSA